MQAPYSDPCHKINVANPYKNRREKKHSNVDIIKGQICLLNRLFVRKERINFPIFGRLPTGQSNNVNLKDNQDMYSGA